MSKELSRISDHLKCDKCDGEGLLLDEEGLFCCPACDGLGFLIDEEVAEYCVVGFFPGIHGPVDDEVSEIGFTRFMIEVG
jgi:hypothetical protein